MAKRAASMQSNIVSLPKVPAPKRERKERASHFGVVAQVIEAFQKRNRLATVLGFFLGGIVPLASYMLAHYEIDARDLWLQLNAYLVLGGMIFSAKTVYEWCKLAFTMPAKAFGFVVLVEGVMLASNSLWLNVAALCYLIVINGIATGCNLSVRAEPKEK